MENASVVTVSSIYAALCRWLICCFLMLIAFTASAQTRGTVEEVKDPRIDTLLARRRQPAGAGGAADYTSTRGYRVQFFIGGSRAAAFAAQNKLHNLHPELRTYVVYQEPNFKVRAGDFRTRMEASKLMQELRPIFPVLFIIAEKINPPLTPTPEK